MSADCLFSFSSLQFEMDLVVKNVLTRCSENSPMPESASTLCIIAVSCVKVIYFRYTIIRMDT